MSKTKQVSQLLDVLGNETKRRILRLLVDELRYFNQLSRDLRKSQQTALNHTYSKQDVNV